MSKKDDEIARLTAELADVNFPENGTEV